MEKLNSFPENSSEKDLRESNHLLFNNSFFLEK